MAGTCAPVRGAGAGPEMAAHVRRQKERLLGADYEICMARARHFTAVYRDTEGMDPALRNALALRLADHHRTRLAA